LAQRAVGTKLKIGSNSIAELTEIGGLDLSADTIDTTVLDSTGGYKEFIGGFKDGGEVSISGFFNPADTNGQIAVYNAFQSGAVNTFQILFPSAMGASWDFSGVVTGINTGAALEDAVSFEATIKVSGQPSLGLTPSANLTALAGSGLSLVPTFAGGTYAYYATTGGTSYTLTATLAGVANIAIYVNGTLVQGALTSGVASAAIAISGIGTTQNVDIVYSETGKTAKTYSIVVHKNA
jgi:predicted secreted protein